MLIFNWSRIYRAAEGNPVEIVRIIRMLSNRYIPKHDKDPMYKYHSKNFRDGRNFLIHADLLIYNEALYTHRDIAIYVGLASFRTLADWCTTGKTTLNVLQAPLELDNLLDIVNSNPLLGLDGMEVSFLYEDPIDQTIH